VDACFRGRRDDFAWGIGAVRRRRVRVQVNKLRHHSIVERGVDASPREDTGPRAHWGGTLEGCQRANDHPGRERHSRRRSRSS